MSEKGQPQPQADKFRDLARQLEADEDESAFEETVKKIVQVPRADTKQED